MKKSEGILAAENKKRNGMTPFDEQEKEKEMGLELGKNGKKKKKNRSNGEGRKEGVRYLSFPRHPNLT